MTLILAFSFPNILLPIAVALEAVLNVINGQIHNLGWSIVVLAIVIRLALWPLNTMQFKGMQKTMALQPALKEAQTKYSSDPQRMQVEIQKIYKDAGTSPFAGCLPLLVQLPILYSVYQAVNSLKFPQILASSLASPDYLLLALYVISMYISVRISAAPVADPQQAMTQKIMAFVSPVMIAVVGHRWPSALLLFWLTTNLMQMMQQSILLRQHPYSKLATANGAAVDATFSVRSAAPTRDVSSSSRRPRKGPRRSSR